MIRSEAWLIVMLIAIALSPLLLAVRLIRYLLLRFMYISRCRGFFYAAGYGVRWAMIGLIVFMAGYYWGGHATRSQNLPKTAVIRPGGISGLQAGVDVRRWKNPRMIPSARDGK